MMRIAVDIGASFTKCGIYRDLVPFGDVVVTRTLEAAPSPEGLLRWLDHLLLQQGSELRSVTGMNIGLHGVVKAGRLVASSRLPQFVDYNFRSLFGDKLGEVMNDAHGAAIGAMHHFRDQLVLPASVLTLGTGVGMSILYGPTSVEPCEDIPSHPFFGGTGNTPLNLHKYLGQPGRDDLGLAYPERSQSGCAEYSARVLEAVAKIQRLSQGKFASFVLLGGGAWFLDLQHIDVLRQAKMELAAVNILSDTSASHRVALDGIVRATPLPHQPEG
jgi:hypothetical protein